MNYSPELKDALLRRMLPPNNESITKISREEGISEQTLRNWRDKARKEGYAAPGTDAVPDDWSTQDKFLVVVETASMNETELAEYARKKGLYVEQIKAWKDACVHIGVRPPYDFLSGLPYAFTKYSGKCVKTSWFFRGEIII